MLRIVGLILILIFSIQTQAQTSSVFTVVLDAGHGGKDPGKVAGGVNEKDVALQIVKKVGAKLEKYPNIKVIYTRDTDTFVALEQRGAIANRAKADLFVSIHCNAHNTSASGAETYVLGLHANDKNFQVAKAENEVIYLEDNYQTKYAGYDINSPESVIGLSIVQEQFLEQSIYLAKLIQDNFEKDVQAVNRGVKQAGFVVLHQTYMPSVLIETGFITHPKERKFLTSNKGQNSLAQSIVKALLAYKDWIQSNSNSFDQVKIEHKHSVEKLVYRIQIAASQKKIEPISRNFKGLTNIQMEKEGKIYRYFYQETHSEKEAQNFLKKAKQKGYKDAYIVVIVNGKRMSLKQYLQK